MLKAILFDLDGTLSHTNHFHYQAWKDVLQERGIEINQEIYEKTISGKLNSQIVKHFFPSWSSKEAEKLADYKETLYREIAVTIQPTPGLKEFINWVDKQKINMGVVTNAPSKNAYFMLETLGLYNAFDVVIVSEDVPRGKPHPDPYQVGLQQLGIDAQNAIAFEDSPTGILSAVTCGIETVGLTTTHPAQELEAAGATLIIDDFHDPKMWQKVENLIPLPL
jgi:HAD superfamily hydrolase (TIGR01509 family)